MSRSPLTIPGILSLGIYLFVALRLEASNSARDVFGFLVLFAVLFLLYGFAFWRSETFKTPSVRQILFFAALFRLAMIFAGLPPGRTVPALEADLSGERVGYDTFLLYDNDIWRYLWDGHVLGSGLSPYENTPRELADDAASRDDAQPPLESTLWWDILDNISYQSYTTVYPALAQYLFALSGSILPGSVFVLKCLIALADLGICWLLAGWIGKLGRPPHYLLLYAWNPLAVKELSGSGHVDALMVLLVVTSLYLVTRRKAVASQLALAAATLAKLGSAALTPIVWRQSPLRTWWALPVSAAALALPLLGQMHHLIQGLSAYSQQWTFNSGPWAAVRQVLEWVGVENPDSLALWITRAVTLAVIAWATWYSGSSSADELRVPKAVFIVLATLVLLNPAVMPWYLLWALPFAALIGNRSWCLLTGLSLLSYLVYYYQSEQSWWLWVEYGVFALFLVAELRPRAPET